MDILTILILLIHEHKLSFHLILCSFYTHFIESFYYEKMLNIRQFFGIYRDDYMIVTFILLMWCITFLVCVF
uniref:Uncharacterized protein n=1 Tax=Catagonus wagneri TaxID=51154 RepID=A0A8C3WGH1_9CETA